MNLNKNIRKVLTGISNATKYILTFIVIGLVINALDPKNDVSIFFDFDFYIGIFKSPLFFLLYIVLVVFFVFISFRKTKDLD